MRRKSARVCLCLLRHTHSRLNPRSARNARLRTRETRIHTVHAPIIAAEARQAGSGDGKSVVGTTVAGFSLGETKEKGEGGCCCVIDSRRSNSIVPQAWTFRFGAFIRHPLRQPRYAERVGFHSEYTETEYDTDITPFDNRRRLRCAIARNVKKVSACHSSNEIQTDPSDIFIVRRARADFICFPFARG